MVTVEKELLKHPGGRPRKWESPQQLEQLANTYIEESKAVDRPITITGLALALGTDRRTLSRYIHEYEDEYCLALKRFLAECENDVYTRGLQGKNNSALSIFGLKNNYGWRDDRHLNVKQDTNVTIVSNIRRPQMPADIEDAVIVEDDKPDCNKNETVDD